MVYIHARDLGKFINVYNGNNGKMIYSKGFKLIGSTGINPSDLKDIAKLVK